MTTFVTSDLHLGHSNILKYNPKTRPYTDANHMNESIIRDWNHAVCPDDLVYILGDVAFCSPEKATGYLRRMNGSKILIMGNHDNKPVMNDDFCACFVSIHDYLEINHDNMILCLFHYPIKTWNRANRGAGHLFGHQHGNGAATGNRSMDVGMDATGQVVSSLSAIVAHLHKFPITNHH